jgi:hypothetical protein
MENQRRTIKSIKTQARRLSKHFLIFYILLDFSENQPSQIDHGDSSKAKWGIFLSRKFKNMVL